MRTRIKAVVCLGIFSVLFFGSWFLYDSVDLYKRTYSPRDGVSIQEEGSNFFGPREYIKLIPKESKLEKEDLPR